MPPWLTSEWVAAGTAVLAVVIGPLVSVYILRRQNEAAESIARLQINASLISASRRAWIDQLRDTLSEFQAALYNIGHQSVFAVGDGAEKEADQIERAILLRSRIALLINPNEEDHKRLLILVDMALNISFSSGLEARKELAGNQHEITVLAQVILKREWERVKAGEPAMALLPRKIN